MITADDLSQPPTSRDNEPLSDHINTELNKYLQEAAERHEAKDNYFDGCHKLANTLPELQEAFLHQEADKGSPLDHTSIETPEFKEDDTGITPVIANTE